jgi:hypothetical protein
MRLSAYEERQLEILESIDPWGQKRDDYRAAKIIQAFRGGRIKDILKEFDFETPGEQPDEDIEEIINRKSAIGNRK